MDGPGVGGPPLAPGLQHLPHRKELGMAKTKKAESEETDARVKSRRPTKTKRAPTLDKDPDNLRVGDIFGYRRNGDRDRVKELHELCSVHPTPHVHIITHEVVVCRALPTNPLFLPLPVPHFPPGRV